MNAWNACDISSPVPQIDEALLRYLSPAELAEIDRLLAPPVDVVSTLPLSVLCAILHAHESKIGREGGEPARGGEPATHPTELSEGPGKIRLDRLDLPGHLKVAILDAFEVGYWRGEVLPELVPAGDFESARKWLDVHQHELEGVPVKLPAGYSIHFLKHRLSQGPRSDDALEVLHAVQKLREASQTHQVRFSRDSATRMDLG